MTYKLLEINLVVMKILGLWSDGPRSFLSRFAAVFIITNKVLCIISITGGTVKCGTKVMCIFETLPYTTILYANLYIYVVVLFSEKSYKNIVLKLHEMMAEFKTENYSIKADKVAHKFNLIFNIYGAYALAQYNVLPFLDYKSCLKRDLSESAMLCGLTTPGAFPFDISTRAGYWGAYSLEMIWSYITLYGAVQPLMLSTSIVYQVIAQLRMIQDNLRDITMTKKDERDRQLRNIIAHHAALTELTDYISETLNMVLLICAAVMSLILSVVSFLILQTLLTTRDIFVIWKLIFLLLGYFSLYALLSMIGQWLIDESEAVSIIAYDIPWYDESNQFKQMVSLVVLRANKALVLRAASVNIISFSSFGAVMSTTYSYLTMMYNIVFSN